MIPAQRAVEVEGWRGRGATLGAVEGHEGRGRGRGRAAWADDEPSTRAQEEGGCRVVGGVKRSRIRLSCSTTLSNKGGVPRNA